MYDLDHDPCELDNLGSPANPRYNDPGVRTERERLQQKLLAAEARIVNKHQNFNEQQPPLGDGEISRGGSARAATSRGPGQVRAGVMRGVQIALQSRYPRPRATFRPTPKEGAIPPLRGYRISDRPRSCRFSIRPGGAKP